MTTYKGIKGLGLQSITSDAVADQISGGTWASSNNLNQARNQVTGTSNATQTAAIAIGGNPGPGVADVVETYDGSSWTEITEVNTSRHSSGGLGTQTAALVVGGQANITNVESWNGSSWSETHEINTGRRAMGHAGASNTSGIVFGGLEPGKSGKTESYNGSAWTEIADQSSGKQECASGGSITSGLVGGGPSNSTTTEEWNVAVALKTLASTDA